MTDITDISGKNTYKLLVSTRKYWLLNKNKYISTKWITVKYYDKKSP